MPKPFVHDLNHNNSANFQKFADAGGVGVIHKASGENGFIDPAYAARRETATEAGLCWGAYHFNWNNDAATQAQLFLKAAKPDNATSLWLDLEADKRSGSFMSLAQAREFLDRIDQAVGRYCGLYSGNRIKELIVHANDNDRGFFGARPFWLSEYGPLAKLIDVNRQPLPWNKYFLWQYTGDGVGPPPHTMAGLEAGADLSTFDGTADQLRAAWPLPMLPIPDVAA